MIKNGDPSTTNTNTDNNNSSTTNPSTGTDTNTNQSSSTSISAEDLKSALFDSINAERQSKGLSALTADASIQKMSDIRANDESQFTYGHSGHTRPDGTPWYSLYKQLGIPYTDGGENVAMSFADGSDGHTAKEIADYVMSRFRGETYAQNHYDNLVKSGTTRVGVSVSYDPSTNAFTIVEDFA